MNVILSFAAVLLAISGKVEGMICLVHLRSRSSPAALCRCALLLARSGWSLMHCCRSGLTPSRRTLHAQCHYTDQNLPLMQVPATTCQQ
jgi:hypothetical protein